MSQDLHLQTLTQLAAGLEKGDFLVRRHYQALLERIDSHNGTLNAFITVTADQALADAQRADDASAAGNAGYLTVCPSSTRIFSVRATS